MVKLVNSNVPYVEDVGLENAVNQIAKTLNSSHIDLSQQSTTVSKISDIGQVIEISFSTGTNAHSASYTINHSLGSIPQGVSIVDFTCNVTNDPETSISVISLSKSSTQVTIRFNYYNSVGGPSSGTVKLLILR